MPLARGQAKRAEPLRKLLGRSLHFEALMATHEDDPPGATGTVTATSKTAKRRKSIEPASGTLTPSARNATPSRSCGPVSIPIDGTLVDAELRLSELYSVIIVQHPARQLARNITYVVSDLNVLAGFSRTVAACAIALLAGQITGRELLPKTAMKELGTIPGSVMTAVAILQAGNVLVKAAERQKGGIVAIPGPNPWLQGPPNAKRAEQKNMWSPPGKSRLQEVVSFDDLSVKKQQQVRKSLTASARERKRAEKSPERPTSSTGAEREKDTVDEWGWQPVMSRRWGGKKLIPPKRARSR